MSFRVFLSHAAADCARALRRGSAFAKGIHERKTATSLVLVFRRPRLPASFPRTSCRLPEKHPIPCPIPLLCKGWGSRAVGLLVCSSMGQLVSQTTRCKQRAARGRAEHAPRILSNIMGSGNKEDVLMGASALQSMPNKRRNLNGEERSLRTVNPASLRGAHVHCRRRARGFSPGGRGQMRLFPDICQEPAAMECSGPDGRGSPIVGGGPKQDGAWTGRGSCDLSDQLGLARPGLVAA